MISEHSECETVLELVTCIKMECKKKSELSCWDLIPVIVRTCTQILHLTQLYEAEKRCLLVYVIMLGLYLSLSCENASLQLFFFSSLVGFPSSPGRSASLPSVTRNFVAAWWFIHFLFGQTLKPADSSKRFRHYTITTSDQNTSSRAFGAAVQICGLSSGSAFETRSCRTLWWE